MNNENGYFYIADDASGTNAHPYFYNGEGTYKFAGFIPSKETYEEITKGFELKVNVKEIPSLDGDVKASNFVAGSKLSD